MSTPPNAIRSRVLRETGPSLAVAVLVSFALTCPSSPALAGGPEGQDAAKPYFCQPAPQGLNETDAERSREAALSAGVRQSEL